MRLPRRGHPRNERWVQQLLDFLEARPTGATEAETLAEMRSQLGPRVTRRQLTSRLRQLVNLGRVELRNHRYRVLQQRLPALLLFQVSEDRRQAVIDAVLAEVPKAEGVPVDSYNLSCNLLVRARVFDFNSLALLCRSAEGAGALVVSGVLEATPVPVHAMG